MTREPTEKLYKYCLRCGRKLKSDDAKKRGMGLICWYKSQTDREKKHKLF